MLFYVREEDHRARIVCSASREHYCLPLNLLEIVRHGPSCLQLCRRRKSGSELIVWANLKFTTIEGTYLNWGFLITALICIVMILFFCTFLALRSQDSGKPVAQIRDFELDQEEELFGS